ncbi:DUF3626 domain-containing protein [Microtetraspora sp. AC03309]|uniref:DUF3626 domain-containing protein n=1 Tax=Microtetraspora sp. AC03309 TaxID=2779376 RepID=UPI001E37D9F9|nr:DUF3626 domain-containing protein [Microtetraspora sp. AC03309]
MSQFVTGTSNGGLTAHRGGDRWHWESRIFGGAYDHAPAEKHPVYGALNFRRKSIGAAPRLGSAHFRLTAGTLRRTTFCYPDSFFEPSAFGVASRMALIELAEADDQDFLDDYIEAQVHGPVRLDRDVEALLLDPSYRGTAVEAAARRLRGQVGDAQHRHARQRLPVQVVDVAFEEEDLLDVPARRAGAGRACRWWRCHAGSCPSMVIGLTRIAGIGDLCPYLAKIGHVHDLVGRSPRETAVLRGLVVCLRPPFAG